MESSFEKSQRQSSIGFLILFVDNLRIYINLFYPILIFWILKFNTIDKSYFISLIVSILIIFCFIAYLKYRNFTFYLDTINQEFIINEGILKKSKTIIQLHKIQHVEINQDLIQRFFGVYGISIDTAGSYFKEGEIKAISHKQALILKSLLLNFNNFNSNYENQSSFDHSSNQIEEVPFIKISFLSLLKIGITTNYIKSLGLILAFFWKLYEFGEEYIEQSYFEKNKMDAYFKDVYIFKSVFVFAILIVLSMFIAILLINLLRIVVTYFDFKITKQTGSLLLSYGLLNFKSTILSPNRVQIITISRNYFQKKMNIQEIKVKQASIEDSNNKNNLIQIPGCNNYERDELLKLLLYKIPIKGVVLKPSFRKIFFLILLSIILPLALFFISGFFLIPSLLKYIFIIPFYILIVGLSIYIAFKNDRLYINNDFIIKQSGVWDIENKIISPDKIQAITTSQLFWHKNADIGTIKIHTAGGLISFELCNYTQIKQFVNLWLFQIESSNKNWM